MSRIASLYRQQLQIRRPGSDTVVATIGGRIVPLSPGDQAATQDTGALAHDFRGFGEIADVRRSDTLTDVATGTKYEVIGSRDAAGQGDHLEFELREVL